MPCTSRAGPSCPSASSPTLRTAGPGPVEAKRPVPCEIGELTFGIAPHGWGKYRFCLDHEMARFRPSSNGVSSRSSLISSRGAKRATSTTNHLVPTGGGERFMVASASDDDQDCPHPGGFTGVTQKHSLGRLYVVYMEPKESDSYMIFKLAYVDSLTSGLADHSRALGEYPPRLPIASMSSALPAPPGGAAGKWEGRPLPILHRRVRGAAIPAPESEGPLPPSGGGKGGCRPPKVSTDSDLLVNTPSGASAVADPLTGPCSRPSTGESAGFGLAGWGPRPCQPGTIRRPRPRVRRPREPATPSRSGMPARAGTADLRRPDHVL
jgi:hypothetical protein